MNMILRENERERLKMIGLIRATCLVFLGPMYYFTARWGYALRMSHELHLLHSSLSAFLIFPSPGPLVGPLMMQMPYICRSGPGRLSPEMGPFVCAEMSRLRGESIHIPPFFYVTQI